MAFFDTTWYVNFGNGSSTGYYAVPVWPGALTPVSAGTWCRQLATPSVGNERCFVAVVAGTTGAAEPVWVVTRGSDSAANIDGTVTWMECTGMAGPNGDLTNCPFDTTVKSATVTAGEVIQNTAGTFLFACTTTGTTSATPPTWNTTTGATTTWNSSSVWTCIGPTSSFTGGQYPHARTANAVASTWGSAGANTFVASTSAETQASAITLASLGTVGSPCSIYCVPWTSFPPVSATTGATISTTGANGITIGSGSCFQYMSGIGFFAGSASNSASIFIGVTSNNANYAQYFESCGFTLNNTSASSSISFSGGSPTNGSIFNQYLGCTVVFGASGQKVILGAGYNNFYGGSMAASGTAPSTLFNALQQCNGVTTIRDCDISGVTGTLGTISFNSGVNLSIQNCKLGSGVAMPSQVSSPGETWWRIHNSDSSGTNYRYYFSTYMGVVQQETTIIRTGTLATDGTTPISWNINSTSNSKELQPFVSEEIAQWNRLTGTAITAACYLTTSDTLTNQQLWMEIEYLGNSGNPLGSTVNTRCALLATATALPTDSVSSWGGAAQTNKYVVTSPSFTPQMAGPIKMRLYVGAASSLHNIYVDPYIYLS